MPDLLVIGDARFGRRSAGAVPSGAGGTAAQATKAEATVLARQVEVR